MSKKYKRATDNLNVALARVDAALAVMRTGVNGQPLTELIAAAEAHCKEAREELMAIRFHAEQI